MNTQLIVHRSRLHDFVLNFSASASNLSWFFQVENDGEIIDVALNNIASYTIGGVTQDISMNPYTVKSGSYYSVSVTKSINGQAASITLKSRRAINKETSVNVPDYQLTGNGYLYSLLNNNTVIKRDPLLLITANYSGGGVWNTLSLIASISLPTNGGLLSWKYIHHDGTDIICWGRLANESVVSNAYVCRIKPDGVVYDYSGMTVDGYTTIASLFNYTSKKYPYSIANDYVNGYFAISCFSSSGAGSGLLLRKSDLSLVSSSFLTTTGVARQMYFNPHRSVIPLVGDVKCPENRSVNVMYMNNYTGQSAYSLIRAKTIKANANSYATLYDYNEYGLALTSYGCTGTGEAGNGNPGNIVINKRLDFALSMSINQSSFGYCNFSGVQVSRRITTFTEAGLGSRYIAVNERSSQFFATLSHASHQDKILVIDPLDANVEIGYIIENAPVLCIVTNNYY